MIPTVQLISCSIAGAFIYIEPLTGSPSSPAIVSLLLPSPQLQAPLYYYQLELPLSLGKQRQAHEKLMSPPIESDCEGTEKQETGEENDFKSPFKSIPLMSSSMETTLFGEVALHMPGWIRVKDKKMWKKRSTAVSLLVKPVEHAATSSSAQFCLFITEPHSQTVVNLFFVLNNAG